MRRGARGPPAFEDGCSVWPLRPACVPQHPTGPPTQPVVCQVRSCARGPADAWRLVCLARPKARALALDATSSLAVLGRRQRVWSRRLQSEPRVLAQQLSIYQSCREIPAPEPKAVWRRALPWAVSSPGREKKGARAFPFGSTAPLGHEETHIGKEGSTHRRPRHPFPSSLGCVLLPGLSFPLFFSMCGILEY